VHHDDGRFLAGKHARAVEVVGSRYSEEVELVVTPLDEEIR
jgi:hypothetical protein